jgi:hypothetical protein
MTVVSNPASNGVKLAVIIRLLLGRYQLENAASSVVCISFSAVAFSTGVNISR